ncbi:MAG: radical SAM domain protein [Deltaproteobacteria bacterium]|nr:radical SAM domain protein [Deltaproteobacteria bacterium]
MMFIARASRISLTEALQRLKNAGLRWIPGGGAEILTDAWRAKLSPKKYTVREYLDGMRVAQGLGFGTTATMVIGFGETWADRIEHLRHIRTLQDETHGFASLLLWTFQPDHTALGGDRLADEEYCRAVALARLYLDNIPIIRSSMLTQREGGAKALLYGAHDFDVPLEDQVTQLAGARIEDRTETVLEWVRQVGVEPVRRTTPLNIEGPNR